MDIKNRDAVAQGYENAADRKYQSLGLSTKLIDQTLSTVEAEAPIYRRYQQVLAGHTAQKLGLSSVLPAELDLGYTPSPPMSLAQSSALILDALQPLGNDYVSRFAALLDTGNGRLDLSSGAHRSRSGTSISAYDAPVALYFGGYDGSLRSTSTLAHEGGHAIHRELMNASGIPIYERNGPHYLNEGFAIFNELLVLDRASQMASTRAERGLPWSASWRRFLLSSSLPPRRQHSSEVFTQRPVEALFSTELGSTSSSPTQYAPSSIGPSKRWGYHTSGCAKGSSSTIRFTSSTICTRQWSRSHCTIERTPTRISLQSTMLCSVADSMQTRK